MSGREIQHINKEQQNEQTEENLNYEEKPPATNQITQ
jgi:hypothetical protein